MSDSEPEEGYRISRALESIDREIRRRKQRSALEAEESLFGGEGPTACPFADRSNDAADEDLRENTIRFENAPRSTHARLLLADGITLPAVERLKTSAEVEEKLWEIINALAMRRVYIRHTNHLTDRELYIALWSVHLNEVTRDLSNCPGSACHIDLLDCGDEHEHTIYLRYYADPEEWDFWSRDVSMIDLPDRCTPPYDRDRHLPKQGLW